MRVLHLDGGRRWGGGQNQVRLLMRELAAHGVEQSCLCPARSPLETRLRAESLPVQGVRWEGGTDIRAFFAILRHAKETDLLHAHDAHALQLAVGPARIRRRLLVATRRVHFPAKARVWNKPARVIAVSEAVRQRLIECEVDEARITVIHSAIDIDEVKRLEPLSPLMRVRLGIPADDFVAGTVGSMFEFKNQKLIPRAAAHERRIQWVIVGDGPERPAVEAAIAAHGVDANVKLAGAPTDARPYIREFDVFVFTSTGEALGTSLLDAMATGVPLVVPDDAGPAEIMGPVAEKTGCGLYPPGDAAALAAQVRRLRDDATLRARMVNVQRERLNAFRIQRASRAVLALYRELVGDS